MKRNSDAERKRPHNLEKVNENGVTALHEHRKDQILSSKFIARLQHWADEDPGAFEFDQAEQVHNALQRLSLPHREVLTLFFLEDLTIAEITDVVGAQPGTVKSRLYYAKQALRKILQEEAAAHE